MTTERQRYWQEAAAEDAERGNHCAALIFAMVSMPSDAERRANAERQAQQPERDAK